MIKFLTEEAEMTMNSTIKVRWETLETSSSKEGPKANSSNGEEKVVQMDKKADDAVTSPTENISLKSELPETIGGSPGDDQMTITKQTDCTEQNEPNSMSSTQICAPATIMLSDTKDENGHAMHVTEKDYHIEERHGLKAVSLKRVSSAKSMAGNIASNVEDSDKAFKLASTELVPSRLDPNPSGELFYLEVVDMDIKRASLDMDGIQFISKLFREPDLVDWGSISDSEEKRNEIDKEEEVTGSNVPKTLHEDWEEEPNMIEILASSPLSLAWYSNQELGEEDKYASHSTDLQDGYDDSSVSVQEVTCNGCDMDSGKEDVNTNNAEKSSLFDPLHQINSPGTEMEKQTPSSSPYSPRIIQNLNNIAMDALESDSEYLSTNADVFLLPTLDQKQMQGGLPESPCQGFQQPLEILTHRESQQDQSKVQISDKKVPSQRSDNGAFPNSHISVIDNEASILEITDSGWEQPPYESNRKEHSTADDIVEQTQKTHVGGLEDDPKFLSSENLSPNLLQDQSKCQITDDTESSDALPHLKIKEQKNQAADDSDLASQASAIERNDQASNSSTLKELIVDEVVVVEDQVTGAVSTGQALTNIGASKSENHPHKLQQPYETKETQMAVSEDTNGTDDNHATGQSIGINGKAVSEKNWKEQSGATVSNQTPHKVVTKEAQKGGVFNIPVKKSTAASMQVREKQKSRSSLFSSCMCCTTVI